MDHVGWRRLAIGTFWALPQRAAQRAVDGPDDYVSFRTVTANAVVLPQSGPPVDPPDPPESDLH